MKKKITTLFLLALGATTYAQTAPGVGVGTPMPRQSAMLEVLSNDKGVLIPRVELKSLKSFALAGGDEEGKKAEVKGMLVFNKTEVKTGEVVEVKVGFHYWDGSQWMHITSEKELQTVVSELSSEIKSEIKKVTEIITGGNKDDKSYLVSYNPDTKALSYLKPKTDGTGYDVLPVLLEDLVKGAETATFIKPIIVKKKVKDPKDPQKEVEIDAIESYIYFNEPAIIAWLGADKDNNTIENIPNDKGLKIDIIEAVSNNFEKVIEKNKETITTVIKETDGNVRVQEDPVTKKLVLQYKPVGSETYVNVDLSGVETVTTIGKLMATETAKDSGVFEFKPVVNNVDAPKVGKGVIYYAYEGEADATGKRTTSYIDLGKDVETLLKENTIVKETFTKEIQTILNGDGGNVYFGKMLDPKDPNYDKAPEVLYQVDAKGVKNLIDISESVKEVFEKIIKDPGTNTEILKVIKEATGDKLTTLDVAVETGDVILDAKVLKQVSKFKVIASEQNPGFNSSPSAAIKVTDYTKLLRVSIYNDANEMVLNSVTDIDSTKTSLKFNFGMGRMYTPLAVGDYTIVLEYVSDRSATK